MWTSSLHTTPQKYSAGLQNNGDINIVTLYDLPLEIQTLLHLYAIYSLPISVATYTLSVLLSVCLHVICCSLIPKIIQLKQLFYC